MQCRLCGCGRVRGGQEGRGGQGWGGEGVWLNCWRNRSPIPAGTEMEGTYIANGFPEQYGSQGSERN